MTCPTSQDINAFQQRAKDVRIDIATTADPAALTDVTFRSVDGGIEITSLTPVAGGGGVTVDVILTDTHLDVWPGTYRWELTAIVSSTLRTVAFGWLIVAPEVTEDSP